MNSIGIDYRLEGNLRDAVRRSGAKPHHVWPYARLAFDLHSSQALHKPLQRQYAIVYLIYKY